MTYIPSMHSETLSDFVTFKQQQQARNDIHLNIVKWCLKLCDVLQADYQSKYNHGSNYTFALDSSGRKYHKVFMYINNERDSIHAFIDKKTGDVFKPASFKAPAKGARYNVLNIQSREEMFKYADWAGEYLYMIFNKTGV